MFMHLQSPPETASGPASVVSSRRRWPPCLRPVVVALAAALGWGTALAQEGTDQADGQVAGSASQLGTVHVREQAASAAFRAGEAEFGPLGRRPVQALPYSVQVIPETLIEDQQASSLTDLLKYMPSAQMQARGGADVGRPQTRGMQSSVVANNHLDGLNVVGTTAYPMEQLAGLEVIQSLTGAFYGPASPAGNFNFISKRPTERPLRRLTLGYVSDARLGLHADLSGAVDANQVLRYRTNLLQEEGEGYVRDSKVRRRLASVALDVHPRAGTVIELNASQYRFVRNGFAGSFSYSADVPLPDAPDPTRVGYGQPYGGMSLKTTTVSTVVKHRISDDWQLTAGLLRQTADRPMFGVDNELTDAAGNYTATVESPNRGRFRVDSNLLRLNGQVRHGGVSHDLVVGTSGYQWSIYRSRARSRTLGQASMAEPRLFDEPARLAASARFRGGKNSQQSLMMADTIGFGPHWSVLLAASWSQISASSYAASGARTEVSREHGWNPAASLMYRPVRDTLLYLSHADSLEQGDSAPDGAANEGTTLKPYRSRQWEAGVKQRWGGLDASAAVFRLSRPFAYVDSSDNLFKLLGDQVNTGLELTAGGEVTRGLNLRAGLTWLNPKLRNTGTASTSNRQVVDVPKLRASVLAEYQLQAVPGLSVNAGLQFIGRRPANETNSQWVRRDHLLDLGARYATRLAGHDTTWRLAVNNVFNRHYWLGIFPGSQNGSGGSYSAFTGNPREIRLSVSIDL